MSNIKFQIKDEIYLNMILSNDLNSLSNFDEVNIFLKNNDTECVLYADDFVIEAFRSFKILLKRALQNKIELPRELKEDIGLHSSKNIQKSNEEDENYKKDVNYMKNYLWDTTRKFATTTWLYNYEGEIIFEVTPYYKWHYDDPEGEADYVDFETFVNNYSPIFKITLERKVAEEWLKKCEEILTIVDSNQ